jgi:transposase-like protein
VLRIDSGATIRQAAACLGVAPVTAHRWWHRWQAGHRVRAQVRDVSADAVLPTAVVPVGAGGEQEQAILTARGRTNYGPM